VNHSLRRRVTARAFALGAVAALAVGVQGVGVAGAAVQGTATIANPSTGTALPSGGSTTSFTVTLPAQAACPGDTASGGYHVYSYLVHEGADVTAITFNNFPSDGFGFVDNTGTYYGTANTAINTGQIVGIPTNFQWGPLVESAGGALPLSQLLYSGSTGSWEAGLVCANSTNHVTNYWTTPVTFTASGTDANGFTWAAVPGVPSGAPEVPLPILLPILGLAIVGGAFGVSRRRRGRLTAVPVPNP
jgi:hypothetical protein